MSNLAHCFLLFLIFHKASSMREPNLMNACFVKDGQNNEEAMCKVPLCILLNRTEISLQNSGSLKIGTRLLFYLYSNFYYYYYYYYCSLICNTPYVQTDFFLERIEF